MVESEKPREKALRYGVESLSNRELLAILLRSGYRGVSVLELSDILLKKANSLGGLHQMSEKEIMEIKGISVVKMLELKACLELSRRISQERLYTSLQVNNPKVIAEYMNQKIGHKKQEHFVVLFLDSKNHLIKEETLFIGSLNTSVVHAREVFKTAISCSSARIMLCHNHPSTDCIPSRQDIQVTENLQEIGKLIGIEVIDHIIVGGNKHFSFAQHGLMK